MSMYTYKVVPFMGTVKSGQSASTVASQLETVIAQYAVDGWDFYQLGAVNIEVKPGCIGGLLGKESDYVRYDQVIFRKNAA